MNIILFTHPVFLNSQSMPRYAKWLEAGMRNKGHHVETWAPQPFFYKWPVPGKLKKWMGYLDQYVLFPQQIKRKMKNCSPETVFVFTDNALGPWVPLASTKRHVVHCHDFLAQRSAAGEIMENPTAWSGRTYQAFIRNGYRKGKNFISVSYKTREDLHRFLNQTPARSEVVYNGLTQPYFPEDIAVARARLASFSSLDLKNGYLLHIGGNHWYKNRVGCIIIYNAWRKSGGDLPLLMIGEPPSEKLLSAFNASPYKRDIHFLTGVNDSLLVSAYSGASVFLFPSLAEGFGWPIAEAMACGCPVITTGETPMSEVAAEAASLLPRMPAADQQALDAWAATAADQVDMILNRSSTEKELFMQAGLKNVQRFDAGDALDQIEHIYSSIL